METGKKGLLVSVELDRCPYDCPIKCDGIAVDEETLYCLGQAVFKQVIISCRHMDICRYRKDERK